MEELLSILFAAAVQFSGLPALAQRPAVTAMPYEMMLEELCADLDTETSRMLAQRDRCRREHAMLPRVCEAPDAYARCTGQKGLVAAYLIKEQRIVYRDDLDIYDDADNSFLVHEFVHALQDPERDGRLFETCRGALEAERQAYAVQQRYLRSRGLFYRVGQRLRRVRCEDLH